MLYIATGSFFFTILILFYQLLVWRNQKAIATEKRMNFIEDMDHYAYDETKSFGERVLLPILNRLGSVFSFGTPSHVKVTQKRKLEKAGFLKDKSYERWVVQVFLRNSIVMMLMVVASLYTDLSMIRALAIGLFILVFLKAIDRFRLASAIRKRSETMLKDLPFTLDLITVSVEAGLSLDGAISRVATNIKGVLSDEFAKTLKEMRMGIDKKIALKNMGDRCEVREISVLMSSLIQADELGVSLGKVLRIEGAQLRENRKQVAREKAMKAPIKMLFPLMIFIFPAVFIIILGPAVLQAFKLL